MAGEDAAATAAWLDSQHVGRRPFKALEPWPAAPDEAFAYAVQDGLLARRQARTRDAVAGYKIGLTTPIMQALCHGDRPISGVMANSTMQRAPARVRSTDYVRLGVESELAVRFGRPLGTRGKPVTSADVAACVTEVAAAFELIEDRGADYQTLDWRWMAADNSWHAGLVLAQSVAPRDIADLSGELTVDGVAVGRGSTGDVLGHPFAAVAWLADHLAARDRHIEAGHWISTGSIVPIQHARPGQRFRFEIAGLPAVVLSVE